MNRRHSSLTSFPLTSFPLTSFPLASFPLASLPLVSLAFVVAACDAEPPPPQRFPVTFTAYTDPGEVLAGVEILANGNPLGVTGADGIYQTVLSGPEGAPVQIRAQCPAGHRDADDLPVLVLRHVASLDPTAAARGFQVSIRCPPLHRHGVLVVRATGSAPRAGLPVRINGHEVSRTDRSGVAHVSIDMRPGSNFQVQLATSAAFASLQPQNPSRTFVFRDADEIFVFDQPFEEPASPAPPPPRVRQAQHVRRPVAPPPLPVKLGRTR